MVPSIPLADQTPAKNIQDLPGSVHHNSIVGEGAVGSKPAAPCRQGTKLAATAGNRFCGAVKHIIVLIALAALSLSTWTDRAQAFSRTDSFKSQSMDMGTCSAYLKLEYTLGIFGDEAAFLALLLNDNPLMYSLGPLNDPTAQPPYSPSDGLVNNTITSTLQAELGLCGNSNIGLREVIPPDELFEDKTLSPFIYGPR